MGDIVAFTKARRLREPLDWAQELKDFRERRDWSQQDLAHWLGCHVSSIGFWETGTYKPSRKYRGLIRDLMVRRDFTRRSA